MRPGFAGTTRETRTYVAEVMARVWHPMAQTGRPGDWWSAARSRYGGPVMWSASQGRHPAPAMRSRSAHVPPATPDAPVGLERDMRPETRPARDADTVSATGDPR